jgi:NAD(P)-dependent dehydrogenase (short-subunit alcohol dehydrogenase family)
MLLSTRFAGVAMLGPLATLHVHSWDTTMAINSRAPLLMAQACISGMIERKAGKIINISSQVRGDISIMRFICEIVAHSVLTAYMYQKHQDCGTKHLLHSCHLQYSNDIH